jgi:5-methylcytosine-specific restriction endonuclease McrA
MESLRTLSSEIILSRTRAIATDERRITVELLQYLREIEARQLFADLGYPSLFEFLVRELRFSESAAYRRSQAMRLLKDVPELGEKIESGAINLSNAAKVQSTLRKSSAEEKRQLMARLEGKSVREADRELAALAPRSAREFTRWLNSEEVQLTFSLERPTFQNLHELQSLRSHKHPPSSYRGIVHDLVELGQKEWNPLRCTVSSAPQKRCDKENTSPSHVPESIRREVWIRDQGACTYQDPGTGKRCGSKTYVQLDHIHPLALGGKHELSNLRLLCGTHNRARARKTFGSPPSG